MNNVVCNVHVKAMKLKVVWNNVNITKVQDTIMITY